MLDPTEVVPEPSPVGEPASEQATGEQGEQPGEREQPSKRPSWWGNVWQRLTSPTTRKPSDYTGRRLPRIVNEVLDGRGVQGAAHEAQVGEALGLVADHALGAG